MTPGMTKDRGSRIAQFEEKAEAIRAADIQMRSELKQLDSLLDEVSQPVIAAFLKRWSERESARLAAIGMNLDVDDRDGRLLIRGQYNQTKILGGSIADFQARVDEIQGALHRNSVELEALTKQLNKLKGRTR